MKKGIKAEIYLVNRQRKTPLDTNRIKRAVEILLAASGAPVSTLGVILVGDRAMSALNRRFTGHAGTTDVLSFSLDPGEAEIVISAETAARQAAGLGHDADREAIILAAHGILHLAGWDDRDAESRRRMDERTAGLLAETGLDRGKSG